MFSIFIASMVHRFGPSWTFTPTSNVDLYTRPGNQGKAAAWDGRRQLFGHSDARVCLTGLAHALFISAHAPAREPAEISFRPLNTRGVIDGPFCQAGRPERPIARTRSYCRPSKGRLAPLGSACNIHVKTSGLHRQTFHAGAGPLRFVVIPYGP